MVSGFNSPEIQIKDIESSWGQIKRLFSEWKQGISVIEQNADASLSSREIALALVGTEEEEELFVCKVACGRQSSFTCSA